MSGEEEEKKERKEGTEKKGIQKRKHEEELDRPESHAFMTHDCKQQTVSF